MKKITTSLFFLVLALFLASCTGNITIDGLSEVSLKEGDTLTLPVESTDKKGLTFISSNNDIVTVDEDGKITAITEGVATITVGSISNDEVTFEITVTVLKRVTLEATTSTIVITAGDTQEVGYTSNDEVTFSTSSSTVFTVDDEGIITGVSEGSATLTITSVADPAVKVDITITVRKVVTLSVTDYEHDMIVGETGQITVLSEEDVTYESLDETILTVSDTGIVTPLLAGETTVVITSAYDEDVKEEIVIKVYNPIESLSVIGPTDVTLYGKEETLSVEVFPNQAYPYVTWSSSNEEIATIDATGKIVVLQAGEVDFIATSTMNDQVVATHSLDIRNQIVVDSTLTSGSIPFLTMEFTYGYDAFRTIQDALEVGVDGVYIFVLEGNYTGDFTITQDDMFLLGRDNTNVQGHITVDADGVYIDKLIMTGNSSITSTSTHEDLVITNIQATDITGSFITLSNMSGLVYIENNTIDGATGTAISLTGSHDGEIMIRKNILTDVMTAISVKPSATHLETLEIKVERNDILNVTDGIIIENTATIHAYVRFNSIVNASGFLARSNANNSVEMTLNYWGMEILDMNKFENIQASMLLGHYALKTQIISEAAYNPLIPVKLVVNNPITEIMIGETHTFTYQILPYDLTTDYIRWITSAPEVMTITREGLATPLRSGEVTLTVRSTQNTAINATVTLTVTTFPGIEITPVNVLNNNLVGTTLTLEATPFPVSIKDAEVAYTSNHPEIASVDPYGIVSLHTPGVVTITASLVDDPGVQNTYTFEVYASLDENNLLDLLTSSMVTYTTPHRWTAVGVGFNYNDFKYESVSRFYFGEYSVNQSKIVPVSPGIRPGEGMTPHPEGITQYNPYNVYWVVVHDTANTNPGSGALAHANYLYSNAMAGTVLNVSWHFTIDDKELYQHLPETERGYHAGDGSVLPGQSTTYLGGGNRNGIGIETGVNQDADVYRTWQRTAKFGTDLLIKYNLPLTHMRYHVDFSGKNCPQTMRNAGLVPLFEEMKSIEYKVSQNFPNAEITFVSDNPEYVDHTGRVIKMPDRAMTVSYTVTVTVDNVTTSRTFYSYLPGTVF